MVDALCEFICALCPYGFSDDNRCDQGRERKVKCVDCGNFVWECKCTYVKRSSEDMY